MNEMSKFRFLLFVLLGLIMSQCGSTPIRQGEVYRAPGDVFSVPSPVGYGGRYDDDEHSVAFYDDLLGFYRIEHGELSLNDIRSLSQYSQAEQLKVFAHQAMLAHIRRSFPTVSVFHEEWIEERRSHLMILTIPRGSTFTINGQHQDVERGLLLFRRGDRMFVLHTQFKPNLFNINQKASASEKISRLKDDLLAFQSSIRFDR